MGSGIAHVSALFGFDSTLIDIDHKLVNSGIDSIRKNLERQVKKDKISIGLMSETLDRLDFSTDINELHSCDLIIEAVTENEEIKLQLYKKLDTICQAKTIFASNTSSISISKIASVTNRPEKVIGMHFMNPVPIMQLVEIVKGNQTSSSTMRFVLAVAQEMSKIPVKCLDSPGFISNRILMPMINEAIFCLYEGIGAPEDIDLIMKLGMAHPMGPLTLADLIGLDVCLNIINVLYSDFNDKKYLPCPLLENMVREGKLGRKTGNGFYNYN